MSAYIKRTERSQINNLMLHLKLLEKQEQAKSKTSRRREIIKIRAEINEIETKNKTHTKNQRNKKLFFEKIGKINKPLTNLAKMRRESTHINKI
jgi:uncharacterized coiled-coil DUF342 family protein